MCPAGWPGSTDPRSGPTPNDSRSSDRSETGAAQRWWPYPHRAEGAQVGAAGSRQLLHWATNCGLCGVSHQPERNLVGLAEVDSFVATDGSVESLPGAEVAFGEACRRVAHGDLDGAAVSTQQLEAALPGAAEARVLVELVRDRRRAPAETWISSFLRAWRRAGRPEQFSLLAEKDPLGQIGELIRSQEAEKLVAAIEAMPADGTITSLMMRARHPDDANLLVREAIVAAEAAAPLEGSLAVLHLLNSGWAEEPVRAEARVVRKRVWARLAREHSHEPFLRAQAILVGTLKEEPLTRWELAELDASARLPAGVYSMADLYRRLRTKYLVDLEPVPARRRAFFDAVALLAIHWSWVLGKRATATAKQHPELAADLRDICSRLGRLLEGCRSLMEVLNGLMLRQTGARLVNDAGEEAAVGARLAEVRGWLHGDGRITLSPEAWPIPPLASEAFDFLGTDEVGLHHLLRQEFDG